MRRGLSINPISFNLTSALLRALPLGGYVLFAGDDEQDGDDNNNKEVQALKDEVALLKEIIREMKGLPEELNRLRQDVKRLNGNDPSNNQNTTQPNHRFVDLQDFAQLTEEVVSLRNAMKNQKGELIRELDAALSIVDKQEKTIVEQQCRIEALERYRWDRGNSNNLWHDKRDGFGIGWESRII